eukprot:3461518-Alexandrium_andersonii.AAC.1
MCIRDRDSTPSTAATASSTPASPSSADPRRTAIRSWRPLSVLGSSLARPRRSTCAWTTGGAT